MNSRVKIIAAVVAVALLGVGGFMFLQNKNSGVPGPLSNGSSMKDSIMGMGSMECNYTDEEGRATKTFIKNGKVRAEITSSKANENGNVIFANETIYIWNNQGAFMMKVPKETIDDVSQNQAFSQKEDLMESIEKYKESCKSANPADSLFTPPANIQFKDFSEMMKMMPSGAPTGNSQAPTQEDIEQMMQQYQGQQ
jgi:hypothetical protein